MMVDFSYEQLKIIQRALKAEAVVKENDENLKFNDLVEEINEIIESAKKRGYEA